MLNYKSEVKEKAENDVKQVVGKKLQLLLPLEIQGTVNDYIFEFVATDFKLFQEKQLN